MKCKNCETELSEMKNDKGEVTCQRCLKCHPITTYVPPSSKESKYVDIPWTDERVIEVIDRVVPDMIREALKIRFEPAKKLLDEIDEKFPVAAMVNWRAQAKELGISLSQPTGGARKKIDVLKDIEDKLKVPA